MEKKMNNNFIVTVVPTDLYKAFNYIPQDLLIVKLQPYNRTWLIAGSVSV